MVKEAKTKQKAPHSISGYELPERLKYIRQSRKMSQKELAQKSKVSQSTIAQVETGKKDPSISTLRKIASALEIEIAVLFASDDVHVFDMARLRKKYDEVEKLNATLYMALGKVVQYAKDIKFLK